MGMIHCNNSATASQNPPCECGSDVSPAIAKHVGVTQKAGPGRTGPVTSRAVSHEATGARAGRAFVGVRSVRPPATGARDRTSGGLDPGVDRATVVDELVRREPERQLLRRVLRAVRRVHEVLAGLEGEVAADRAQRSLVGSRRAVDRAADRDRVQALDSDRDERRGCDEVHQPGEERLLAMDVVVLLRERSVRLHQLEPDDAQPTLLIAVEDAPHQQTLDAVRLDEDQAPFAHETSLRTGPPASAWWAC